MLARSHPGVAGAGERHRHLTPSIAQSEAPRWRKAATAPSVHDRGGGHRHVVAIWAYVRADDVNLRSGARLR
jgi:hypothetical protein